MHDESQSPEQRKVAANAFLGKLDEKCKERWIETMKSIDVTHSSRRAWQTINKLTGKRSLPSQCPISANLIASQLLKNGKFKNGKLENVDKDFARRTSAEVIRLSKIPDHSPDCNLSGTREELQNAIAHLQIAKAPGLDHIHPEFIKNLGKDADEWLRQFLSFCLGSFHFVLVPANSRKYGAVLRSSHW